MEFEENQFDASQKSFLDNKFLARGIFAGTSDFFKLRKMSSCIADKTMLISHFLKSSNEVSAILYPRRFGKSTNLDMIKSFVELDYRACFNDIDSKNSINSIYFLGGKLKTQENKMIYLQKMKIANEMSLVNDYLGKYPVIYLDFKICDGNNFEHILDSTKTLIKTEFSRHDYLENSDKISEADKLKFKTYLYAPESDLKRVDLIPSFLFLSKLLFLHWKKGVMVFIDEYDHPIFLEKSSQTC